LGFGFDGEEAVVLGETLGLGDGANFDLVAEPYWEHGVSVQWNWRNVGQFTVGIRNLFNEKPPTISGFPVVNGQFPRIGNFFGVGDYDYLGRSVFVNATRTF